MKVDLCGGMVDSVGLHGLIPYSESSALEKHSVEFVRLRRDRSGYLITVHDDVLSRLGLLCVAELLPLACRPLPVH